MADLKLNQLIALQKPAKAAGESALTKAYQNLQRGPALAGVRKTYESRMADGQELPDEGTKLQLRVPEILASVVAPIVRKLDLTASVDAGNQVAKASVVLDDGTVLLENVAVTTLLTIEKQLANFAEVLAKVPTLDASENWHWDTIESAYRSDDKVKARSEKVPTTHVKAEATDKHPAQTDILYLDKVVGDWTTVLYSGALHPKTLKELMDKLTRLQSAVKVAREQANMTVTPDVHVGQALMDYLGLESIQPVQS